MRGELTAGGRAALATIAAARRPWVPRADLERRHGAEAVEGILAGSPAHAEAWRPGDAELVTLTPWGAEQLRLALKDRWQSERVEEEREVRGARGRTRRVRRRVKRIAEVPRWGEAPTEEELDDERHQDPIVLPRWDRVGVSAAQLWWSLLPDTRPGTDPVEAAIAREEAVIDPASGKAAVRAEDGQPLRLLGVPVLLDRRLARPAG